MLQKALHPAGILPTKPFATEGDDARLTVTGHLWGSMCSLPSSSLLITRRSQNYPGEWPEQASCLAEVELKPSYAS